MTKSKNNVFRILFSALLFLERPQARKVSMNSVAISAKTATAGRSTILP